MLLSEFPKLLCPVCGNSLLQIEEGLSCSRCDDVYPIHLGTPRVLERSLRLKLLSKASTDGSSVPPDQSTRFKLRTAASFGYEWQKFRDLRAEWQSNFLEYMQPRNAEFFRGKRVLDAGCGTGRHAYYAAAYGAEVTAVDLSEAIDVARENTRGVGNVHTVQADLYNLPFELESFDFIYSIGVLHHLPDPEGAFQNLLRYLQPGGEIQIYLYWWPQNQPIKSMLLWCVNGARALTTRLPHQMLYWLSYPLAALAYVGFVFPYRVLRSIPVTAEVAERLPMKQYAAYPFVVCVNDQFDRFSAPIENRYTRDEVRGWLERAGLTDIQVLPNWGWLGTGKKSVSSQPTTLSATSEVCTPGSPL